MNKSISSVFTAVALLAGSGATAAPLPAGYKLGTKVPLPATFAADMKTAFALTQDDLGCTWASRPQIYAFDNALIFVGATGTDYNAFAPASALAKGCWLPDSIVKNSGYTGLPPVKPGRRPASLVSYSTTTLAENGLPVPSYIRDVNDQITKTQIINAKWPVGFDYKSFLKNGVQLTQRQMNCTWAAKPFIYAFADGLIFSDGGDTYNAFSLDEAKDPKGNNCWLPDDILGGGEGDADINTNGETAKEEVLDNYIDTHNASQLCVGRWRWTETYDEGYFETRVCSESLVPYEVTVVDVDRGDTQGVLGLRGVTRSLSTSVVTVDLGIAEASDKNTSSSSASVSNNAATLLECNARVREWTATQSFRRGVANRAVVENKPEYAAYAKLFEPMPLDVSYNKVVSNSPVTQGAKCTASNALGACTTYTNKRQCQVDFQLETYTVLTRTEIRTKLVKDDPSCVTKEVYVPVIKTFAGQSKLNATFADIAKVDNSFVELTKSKPRSNYICSSGVHLTNNGLKYSFLNNYISLNKNKPDIIKDPEFFGAMATFWALFIEKSDVVADTDGMGLDTIAAAHKLFPTAVFKGQSDAELGLEDADSMPE